MPRSDRPSVGATDPARRVVALAQRTGVRCGSTLVVAVDGPSGAGKTVLADRIVTTVRTERVPVAVVRMDDLYAGWDGLAAAVPLLVEVLTGLAAGRSAHFPRYDWAAGRYGATVEILPGGWLVVDGVGSGANAVRHWLSVLVWVDAPESVRFRRAMDRDGDGYRPHWRAWADQERTHFAAERTVEAAQLHVCLGAGEAENDREHGRQ